MSLAAYKKASSEKLEKALAATQTKFKKDERYWELSVDKAGNGFAIVRFLDRPVVDGDDATAFVQIYTHNFQGPGGWYIENSLTTLDQNDPVSEYNSKLWATKLTENQDIARTQKRKLSYISNVLVVKDPTKPENDGKVFLFKYGKKIFDKIHNAKNPRKGELDADGNEKTPVNVFDLWEGANFSLSAQGIGRDRNYDASTFSSKQTPVAKTEAGIEKIIMAAHSLKGELKFKTYDELKKKLDRVLAFSGAPTTTAETAKIASEVPAAVAAAVEAATTVTGDDDDDMSFFKKMAQAD